MADQKMGLDLQMAFLMIIGILGLIGIYTVLGTIWPLIYGVVADVGTSGAITVHPDVATYINSTVTVFTGFFAELNTSMTLAISLVVLVIVLIIFWPLIQKGWSRATGAMDKGGDVM